jgi:hypothetical protein
MSGEDAPIRRLGDGYEPHVDDVADRLTYGLLVDSRFVGMAFSFEVAARDLEVLLADPYRRAVLEVAAHAILQRSMIRGNPIVTQVDFSDLVDRVLHDAPDALADTIAAIGRNHRTNVDHFARAALARRAAPATEL